MEFDIELVVFVFSLLGTIISMVWKLAQLKEQIHDYIDKETRKIETKQNSVNHNFDISIRENKYQKDKDILLINGKVDQSLHKSSRLENAIKDINDYLEKTGDFAPRRGLRSNDD